MPEANRLTARPSPNLIQNMSGQHFRQGPAVQFSDGSFMQSMRLLSIEAE
jgi:hypothetical protein